MIGIVGADEQMGVDPRPRGSHAEPKLAIRKAQVAVLEATLLLSRANLLVEFKPVIVGNTERADRLRRTLDRGKLCFPIALALLFEDRARGVDVRIPSPPQRSRSVRFFFPPVLAA